MARRAVAHKAVHRAAKHRPSTLAKVGALLAAPLPDVELLIGAMANPDSGIKFVLGIAKKAGRRISEVQSVIFDKLKWTADAAKGWLRDHGFSPAGKDEGATFWRFRQADPKKYREFRTIVPGARQNPQDISERVLTYNAAGRPVEVLLTTRHSASSYGLPVAVIHGKAYGPGDRPFGKPLYVEVPSVALHPGGTISSDPNQPAVKGTLHERLMKFARYPETDRAVGDWNDRVSQSNPDVGESISSYQEHLETTTDPDFQAATPGEQAAAMTAQDLCENPWIPLSEAEEVLLLKRIQEDHPNDPYASDLTSWVGRHGGGLDTWAYQYGVRSQEGIPRRRNPGETYPDSASIVTHTREGVDIHKAAYTPEGLQAEVETQKRWTSPTGGPLWIRVYEYYPGGKILKQVRVEDGKVTEQNPAQRNGFDDPTPSGWGVTMGRAHAGDVIAGNKPGRYMRLSDAALYNLARYFFDHNKAQWGFKDNHFTSFARSFKAGYRDRLEDYKREHPGWERAEQNPAYGQVQGRGWMQEWYETASGDARARTAQLRKLGYRVTASSMGSQVTPVGSVKMTLVDIRAGTSRDEELDNVPLPASGVVRMNPSQFDSQRPNLGHAAFDAAKDFRLSGAYSETGVANARVAKYGFTKWWDNLPPLHRGPRPARTRTKARLLKNWMEGWAAGKRVEKRGNPESAAADLYEEFHGKPAGETLEIVTEKHEHEWLTQLGVLVELKVATLTNLEATIRFDKDAPQLCSSEDGRQLYIEGGDQSIDLKTLKMDGDKWRKDSMALGVLVECTYQTEKGFQKFQLTDYYHHLGEETGVQPFLLYDPNNQLLSVSGGQYEVKPEGIVN